MDKEITFGHMHILEGRNLFLLFSSEQKPHIFQIHYHKSELFILYFYRQTSCGLFILNQKTVFVC